MTLATSFKLDSLNESSALNRRGQSGKLAQLLFLISLFAGSWGLLFLNGKAAIGSEQPFSTPAQTELLPDPTPFDITVLKPENTPASAVTANMISETGLTVPSLWWMKEQYAAQEQFGDKLIENWIAYPVNGKQSARVDLVVNRQLWSMLDYLQRYSFIHDFGSAARDYGYNIRVFDSRANFLAAYTCNYQASIVETSQLTLLPNSQAATDTPFFSPYVQPTQPIACDTLLDYEGKSSLRGNTPNQVDGGSPRASGTGQR